MADTPSSPAPPPLNTWQMVKMFSPIVIFSILLPLVDILTDLRMIITLYTGVYACNSNEIYWIYGQDTYREIFDTCRKDASTFCQQNPSLCSFAKHEKFATMLLSKLLKQKAFKTETVSVPFLLNYFASFLTWYRREKNKLQTFIFPLLNIYPIFGKQVSFSLPIIILKFRCREIDSRYQEESINGLKDEDGPL